MPDATTDFSYGLLCFSTIVFVLFCIQFGAMYVASRDKVRAQEETIAQQQAHMELLEELQSEIRAFRHDFTNFEMLPASISAAIKIQKSIIFVVIIVFSSFLKFKFLVVLFVVGITIA